MKKILLSSFVIIFTIIIFTSCATILATKTHAVSVGSDPHGADIYVNGFKMGQTPMELSLKADKSYTIEYRKEGYESVTRIINTKVGAGWVVVDIVFGFYPVIIDAITGSWSILDQDNVNAALVKQQNK